MARPKKGVFHVKWAESGECKIKIADGLFEEGNGIFADAIREVSGREKPRIFLVADSNVVQKTEQLGVKIGRSLSSGGIEMAGTPVMVSGGERVKSDGFATIGKIAKAVFEARLAPSDVLVAIGGGTVIDAAGFAAASVRGGVKFVIVPTTIAAAMDSTFMESARIDAMDVKDAIRIRMRPSAALIDVGFSSTVLDGVWRGGLGALTRYAAASDAGLMKRIVAAKEELKARDMEMLSSLLKEAVASCASNGSPNTGLWAAHRLESMSNFKLPHGYAVPMGVCMDCAYGVKAGILSETDAQTIRSTLEFFGAFEGFMHSHHILGRVQSILRGIDTWWLSGDGALDIPRSIGKTVKVEFPDREIYAAVLEELVADVMNRPQGQEKHPLSIPL